MLYNVPLWEYKPGIAEPLVLAMCLEVGMWLCQTE